VVLPVGSGPVKLIALVLAAATASPLTVLPRPRFNAPASPPKATAAHFVVLSSHTHAAGELPPPLWPRLELSGPDGATRHVVSSPGRYAFDFARYAWPPHYVRSDKEFVYEQVVWATEAPTAVLYVETAHATYARSSYGLNGYLNAVDVKRKKLLWRSPALVANADDFVLLNDVIVSGYGFTDEPDYLYAVSRETGRVVTRLLLPNAAERIVRRGGTLYVRTYDRDLVVRLVGA
jgi:hypothetical protein